MYPFKKSNPDHWIDEEDPRYDYQLWASTTQVEEEKKEREKEKEEKKATPKRKRSEGQSKLDQEREKVRKSFSWLKEQAVDKELFLELCKAEEETMAEYDQLFTPPSITTTMSMQLIPVGLPPALSSPLTTSVNTNSVNTNMTSPSQELMTDSSPVIDPPSGLNLGSPPLLLGSTGPTGLIDTVSITPPPLRFIFMDVGQGNSTLVLCPGGETILVDLGCASNSATIEGKKDVGIKGFVEPKVREFLIQHTGKKLDYLIVSHGDKDHLNMIKPVLEGFDVKNVICGGSPEQFKEKKSVLEGKKKVEKKVWRIGEELGDKAVFLHDSEDTYGFYTEDPGTPNQKIKVKDVDVYIVGANAHGKTNKSKSEQSELRKFLAKTKDEKYPKELVEKVDPGTDTNASCIVLLFCYRGQKVMISADATFNSEREILENSKWNGYLDSYALIGGHHGSSDSFSREFLRAVDPSWLMFSADVVPQFAHPTIEVVSRVLRECKNLKNPQTRAWGPHGIVVGSRWKTAKLEEDLKGLLRDMMPLFEAILNVKKTLDKLPSSLASSTLPKEWIVALVRTLVMLREIAANNPTSTGPVPPHLQQMWNDLLPYFGDMLLKADLVKTSGTDHTELLNGAVEFACANYLQQHASTDVSKSESLPPLLYWAVQFSQFEVELQRIKDLEGEIAKEDKEQKGKGKYALWYWLMTEYNMFTTMETAESGVYWMLEIDGNGVPHTGRW